MQALWRLERGIAPVLLILGAFAGMTLGAVAYAQVAFRSASSATQPIPTFRAAASAGIPASATITPRTTPFPSAAVDSGVLSITFTKPAGTVQNDVMITSIAIRPNTATITLLAGWTLVRRVDNAGPTASSLAVYRKVAGAAEPASYAWTLGGAPTGAAGGIQSFGGVDTTTPIDVENGAFTTVATYTPATPTVTTRVANTMLVTSHGIPNRDLWANPPTWGGTQGFQVTAGVAPIMTQGSYALQAAIGATGTKTATDGPGPDAADFGNAHILALRPVAADLTINKPGGTALNDVMIASIAVRPYTVATTPPAGWALVTGILNNNEPTFASSWLLVYSKVAGASEPASYTWTPSAAHTGMVGGIQSFYNVDTTTPIDVQQGQNWPTPPAATLSFSTPSVTTTAANTMLVTSHEFTSSATSWTPPTPPLMAQGFAVASLPPPNGVGISMEGNYLVQAGAGATGVKTATASNDADVGNAHILALRPALQSSITINKPAGTVTNDVMITSLGFSPNTLTITTPPAGWTLVRRVDNTNANGNSLAVYRLTAGASEPANYTWTFSATGYLAGGILTFQGVDTTTPIDVSENGNCTQQGSCATQTLSHATPSITPAVSNTYLVTSHTYSSAGTWTPPPASGPDAAMTEAVSVQHGTQSLEVNYVPHAAASTATGAKTATAASDADVGNAHILALRPLPSAVPGSFNAFETSTAANAIAGQIYTKLVGTSFSLDVVAILSGAQQATFTNTVQVDLVTGSTGGSNCPGTPVTIAGTTQSVSLTSGRGTTGSFNVAISAYRDVRVRVRYPVVSPTVTSCSTDNFSIRPTAFTVTSTNATQTGTSGTPAIKTGANFNLTAASVAGYDGTPSIDNTKVVGTATAGTLGGSFGAAPAGTGTATGASFFYSEVGNFGLNVDAVRDTGFTSVDPSATDCIASSTSNTLSGGKYGCWIGSNAATGASGFGRFIPDNFNVAYTTAPVFGTVCGTFTYVGTGFTYATAVMTVTARNGTSNGLTNAPTVNYAGSYMKLSNAAGTSLNQAPYDTRGGRYTRFDALGGGTTPALDTTGLPPTTGDPAIGAFSGGSGTLTFAPGTGLAFTRSTTTPNAPFNADIALALNVIDTDGVAFAGNPASFGAATAGNGILFSGGNGMRFGRLAIRNANGSQLVPLPVPLETQYWSGTAFVTNAADSCTALAGSNIMLSNPLGGFTVPPGSCTTSASNPVSFSNGRGNLIMAKPSGGAMGSVDLAVNLGTTASGNTCVGGSSVAHSAANKTYLQGAWTGGTYTVNPSARATFGVYKGSDEVIFIRENF